MNFQELTKSINQFLVKMQYGTYTVRFRDAVEFLLNQQGHHDQDVTILSRNRTHEYKPCRPVAATPCKIYEPTL